jgi:hypothetical protein
MSRDLDMDRQSVQSGFPREWHEGPARDYGDGDWLTVAAAICTPASGRPTRSASTADVPAPVVAAIVAPAPVAPRSPAQPYPRFIDDDPLPLADRYPTPTPEYRAALAILSASVRAARHTGDTE